METIREYECIYLLNCKVSTVLTVTDVTSVAILDGFLLIEQNLN